MPLLVSSLRARSSARVDRWLWVSGAIPRDLSREIERDVSRAFRARATDPCPPAKRCPSVSLRFITGITGDVTELFSITRTVTYRAEGASTPFATLKYRRHRDDREYNSRSAARILQSVSCLLSASCQNIDFLFSSLFLGSCLYARKYKTCARSREEFMQWSLRVNKRREIVCFILSLEYAK